MATVIVSKDTICCISSKKISLHSKELTHLKTIELKHKIKTYDNDNNSLYVITADNVLSKISLPTLEITKSMGGV